MQKTMTGVYLTGHGGLEKLELRHDIPVPTPEPGDVLINVTAAGMNNTDINTRIGWYSRSVSSGTTTDVDGEGMGDWDSNMAFPRIQGADVVGRIVAVGPEVDPARIGERVVCDPYIIDPDDPTGLDSAGFLGLEYDGGFAQFIRVPDRNVLAVPEDLPVNDSALATLPCSGGTAMNMLLLAGAREGDLAMVTGASGGVGSFLVQILKALGAEVVAICGTSKREAVVALGADHLVDRASPDLVGSVLTATGGRRLSLVADVVGGDAFTQYLQLLRRGGRYVTAGAIAGPLVNLDLRTLYLKSLSFFGSTVYRRDTFRTLVDLTVSGKIRPAVASTWPLSEIHAAQTAFLGKTHVGSLVLLPPPLEENP